jgi:dTDP-4-amino-4,6-dideoxygalactose transaminase
MFLAFYIASFFGDYDLSRYLWESVRSLDPLPPSYRKRYTNAQASIGIKMLENIDAFNALNRAHAKKLTAALKDIGGIQTPATPPETESVYYQYCIRAADPDLLKHRAIRSGVDVEIMHVDICNVLDVFHEFKTKCPEAEGTEHTLQLPVYASLKEKDLDRIIRVIREAVRPSGPLVAATERTPHR